MTTIEEARAELQSLADELDRSNPAGRRKLK